jgi:hypothetical protein
MGAISNWLNDHIQTKMVDVIVDDTNSRLRQRDKLLDPYMPIKNYDSRNFLAYVVNRVNTLASVVSYGAEIPTTRQGALRKLTTQLVKLALQRVYDENMQWEMIEAMELAGAKGVEIEDRPLPDGSIIKGVNNDLADYIYGNIEDLTKSIYDTLHAMAWQCIQFGEVNYSDFRTDTETKIDWKESGADYNHFPNTLTATGSSADVSVNRWDDYDYADGLQTLFNAVDTFNDTNGFTAEAIVMSRKLRNKLLQQKSTKEAARMMMALPQVGTVSPDALQKLLEDREIPQIITFDELYEVENNEGNLVKGRFLNENRFCFLTKGMGERAFGITIESKNGMNGTPKSGIYVSTFEKSKSPVLDVTQAIATALPIVINPKLLYSQAVIP